jgi:hypothetical protein
MEDAVLRAGAGRNLVERIAAHIPGFSGYLDRELRREVDQLLREQLAARLDEARGQVAGRLRQLPLYASTAVQRLAAVDASLDHTANELRHAGSGYAGLFDAVKVREGELQALYRFDLALVDAIDAVVQAAAGLGPGAEALDDLERTVAAAREQVGRRGEVVKAVFAAPSR